MHRFVRTATVATFLFVSACVERSAKPQALCSVDLIQSSTLPEDSVGPVVIKVNSRPDTIPHVLSSLRPVVSPDGVVHGIGMTREGEATKGYDFDACNRKLKVFPLPADLNGYFHKIAFSSDARFFAYVAHAKSGVTRGVVRSWPTMESALEAAPSEGYPSDVETDDVRWIADHHVRISYRIKSGDYVMIDAQLRGPLKIDTLMLSPISDSSASMSNTR